MTIREGDTVRYRKTGAVGTVIDVTAMMDDQDTTLVAVTILVDFHDDDGHARMLASEVDVIPKNAD